MARIPANILKPNQSMKKSAIAKIVPFKSKKPASDIFCDLLARAIIIAWVVLLFSCSENSSAETPFKHSPPDTTKTPAVYYSVPYKEYKLAVVYRIDMDSLTYSDIDSTTKRKSWQRMSFYFEPFVDSVRGIDQKVLMDSTGKASTQLIWMFIQPQNVVRDMRLDVDSLKNEKSK
jgi:hypothetical protein